MLLLPFQRQPSFGESHEQAGEDTTEAFYSLQVVLPVSHRHILASSLFLASLLFFFWFCSFLVGCAKATLLATIPRAVKCRFFWDFHLLK